MMADGTALTPEGLIRERFGSLTEIQEKAIPAIAAGENALLLAPTGYGKCVAGDTVILTTEGPIKIQEAYLKQIKTNTLDKKFKIAVAAGAVIKKKKSRLFLVKTNTGRSIKVTSDHKFLVSTQKGVEWRPLREVGVGDYIACSKRLILADGVAEFALPLLDDFLDRIAVKTSPSAKEIYAQCRAKTGKGTRRMAKLLGCGRQTLQNAIHGKPVVAKLIKKLAELAGGDLHEIRVEQISGAAMRPLKVSIDEEFAYFAGLFAGDGNFNQGNIVRLSTGSPEILDFVRHFCKSIGLEVKRDRSHEYDYYICSKALYIMLNTLGIPDKNKSRDLAIPRIFFKSRTLLARFLRGAFDTDGSVYGCVIELTSKSRRFIDDVALALLCYGIFSVRKERKIKGEKYYRLLIEKNDDLKKFHGMIGFGEKNKAKRLKQLIANRKSNPNLDVIPNTSALLRACKAKMKLPYSRKPDHRLFESYVYGYRNPSQAGLKRVLKMFQKTSRKKPPEFRLLSKLAASDIFWDKISSIDYFGKDYVYDATIPATHNFIGNGLVLHNTEAALLPVLMKIKGQPGISALYITPLRSLNRDLLSRFHHWCEKLGITRDIRHGDTPQSARTRHRKHPPQIMLTTIESLQALLVAPIMRKHLANVRYVIVDEVHDTLDNKRGAQLSLSLERLAEIADFKRIGISATLANPQDAAGLLFGSREYRIIEGGRGRKMDIKIEYIADREKRFERLKQLAESNRSLIFVNTRSSAEEIGAWLREKKAPVEVHHGSLSKEVRIAAEDKFKSGEVKSLLCTSSLELGIDVGDTQLVIQYGSPHQAFRLIQRVGRSGHTVTGMPRGVILPTDYDDLLESEVLVSLAENGWMEKKTAEKGALDVIAHQLTGLLVENYVMKIEDIHRVLSRSEAYGIGLEKLKKIALQLHAEGLLFFNEDGTLKARRRAREYYYSYLSTIPKTKRFVLKDTSSNRAIASLDEDFVGSLAVGDEFLSKGQVWEALDITDDEVLAVPGSGIDIAIPSWIGEEIPVAREVAENAGALRRAKRKEKMLPDEKTIIIESMGELVIIHSCFGSKVNETLARVFAYRLSELLGESVRTVADPYRIMIKLPFALQGKKVMELFSGIRNIRAGIEQSLRNSTLLRMRFTHVARMFGLIEEDSTVSQKFIDALRYSVVYEEAVRAILSRYFDSKGAEGVLEKVRAGGIKLILDERKEPSFFAAVGIARVSAKEAVGAFEPRERMIAALKEKILSKTEDLVCLNCGATRYVYLATATDSDLKCPKCGERALAMKYKKQEEREHSAALIRNHGKRALLAMAVYGIGPVTAERILSRLQRDENAFYLALIEAQKTFVKTKKYWKA